jgi:hypothetical protein
MRSLAVVAVDEVVELRLLLKEVLGRGLRGLAIAQYGVALSLFLTDRPGNGAHQDVRNAITLEHPRSTMTSQILSATSRMPTNCDQPATQAPIKLTAIRPQSPEALLHPTKQKRRSFGLDVGTQPPCARATAAFEKSQHAAVEDFGLLPSDRMARIGHRRPFPIL